MTLYEVLEVFKSTSEDAFDVVVKEDTNKLVFNNKVDFYRMRKAIEYHEDMEDMHIADYADKTVVNIDIIHNIITVEI